MNRTAATLALMIAMFNASAPARAGECSDSKSEGVVFLSVEVKQGGIYEVDACTGEVSLRTEDDRSYSGKVTSSTVTADGTLFVNYKNSAGRGRISAVDYHDATQHEAVMYHSRQNICGMVYDGGSLIYGVDSDTDELLRFDLEDRSAEVVGDLGVALGACGATWDEDSERMLVFDNNTASLYSVDLDSGAAGRLVTLDIPKDYAIGLAFDPLTGDLLITADSALWRLARSGDAYASAPEFVASTTLNGEVIALNDLEAAPH
jgi:sugar lactone lactonase YvrE